MQIAGDPTRPKSVTLSQIQDLGDDRARRASRRVKRRPGPITEARLTVALVPGSPFVEGLARKAVMPARLSHCSRKVTGLPDQLQTPGNHSVLLVLVHGLFPG